MNKLAAALITILCLVFANHTMSFSKSDDFEYPKKKDIRIIRDVYGVPHIFASKHKYALYGLGYAMAEDRVRQIMKTKYFSMGRLAEIDGEVAFELDKLVRSYRLDARANELVKGVNRNSKILAGALCKGINDYINENRDSLPAWTVTITTTDLLRALLASYYIDEAHPNCMRDLYSRSNPASASCSSGAVGPSRSKSGNALFVFDFHGAYDTISYQYEAHISTPEYSAIGGFIPGNPDPSGGHNGFVAWGDPQNYPDVGDVYKFPLDPVNPNRYRSYDGWHTLTSLTEVFKIKTDGGMTQRSHTFYYTHVGPVIRTEGGYIYSARIADRITVASLNRVFEINKSKTVNEYISHLREADYCIGNYLLADTQGNIAYVYKGTVPKRDPSLDWSRPVPGDDPRSEWDGYLSWNEMPEVINPQSGWIQNCNNAPWKITDNSGIDKNALAYRVFCNEVAEINDRGRRLSDLFRNNQDISLNRMKEFFKDDLVIRARLWIPSVIQAFDEYADSLSLRGTITEQAVNLLRNWDCHARTDSREMTLFRIWYIHGTLRRIEAPGHIDGAVRRELLDGLTTAANLAMQYYGRLDPVYGTVHFLEHDGQQFSLNGFSDALRTTWTSYRNDGLWRVRGGKTHTVVIEMSETPKAFSFVPMSQNENPGHKHYSDLTQEFAKGKYKPLLFTWRKLKKKIESDVTFKYGRK